MTEDIAKQAIDKLTTKSFTPSDLIFDEMRPSNYKFLMDVYNKSKPVPLQKIWIQVPKVRVCFDTDIHTSKDSASISVTLGPLTDIIKDTHHLISSIEDTIRDRNKNKELEFKGSIKKIEGFFPKFSCNIPIKDGKWDILIYDHSHKKIELDKFSRGDYISMFIELEYVWMRNHDFGVHWTVKQVKTYPIIDFSVCLFINEKPIELPSDKPEPKPQVQFQLPPARYEPSPPIVSAPRIPSKPAASNHPPRLAISAASLLAQKSSLRSIAETKVPAETKKASFVPNQADILAIKGKLKKVENKPSINPEIVDQQKTTIRMVKIDMLEADRRHKKIQLKYQQVVDNWEELCCERILNGTAKRFTSSRTQQNLSVSV